MEIVAILCLTDIVFETFEKNPFFFLDSFHKIHLIYETCKLGFLWKVKEKEVHLEGLEFTWTCHFLSR